MSNSTHATGGCQPRNSLTPPRGTGRSASKTAAIATAATPATGVRIPQRKHTPCGHCGSLEPWGDSPWCLRCGYYPKLGMCIPLDALKNQEVEEKLEDVELPRWVWGLGLGVLAILAVRVYARLNVPLDGPRTVWALIQVVLGLTLLAVSHVQAYVVCGGQSDKVSLVDMFLAPLSVWRPVFALLPSTRWLVMRGGWGAAATVCGLFVVGGLGWDELSHLVAMKARAQQKVKPLQAIARMARGSGAAGGPQDLEGAMQSFIEELGADQLVEGKPAASEESPGLKRQCAIIGYTRSVGGELRSVLLASVTAGQPDQFLAKVPVDKLPAAIIARLDTLLPELRTSQPSVECPLPAFWVRPELTCIMSFEPGEAEGEWKESKFLELIDQAGMSFDAEQTLPTLEDTKQTLEQSLPALQDALSRD